MLCAGIDFKCDCISIILLALDRQLAFHHSSLDEVALLIICWKDALPVLPRKTSHPKYLPKDSSCGMFVFER